MDTLTADSKIDGIAILQKLVSCYGEGRKRKDRVCLNAGN